MGIPYYFYNLSKKYKCITVSGEGVCDVLYFDYNSLLHPYTCEYISKNPDTWTIEGSIYYCLQYTLDVIEMVKPKCSVIVIDGVAPRAKMKQQRSRRYKSSFMNNGVKGWDSNQITPGTKYMEKLLEIISVWKEDYPNIKLSSWISEGEGEHKIFKMIHMDDLKDKLIYIYGLDADLIMISLLHTEIESITLFRDNLQGESRYMYVNINLLRKILCMELEMPTKEIENVLENIQDYPVNVNLIQDYILICCLLGNDFLEPIPTLLIQEGGLEMVVEAYKNYYCRNNKFLTKREGGKIVIDYKMLSCMLYFLTKREERVFRKMYMKDLFIKGKDKDVYNMLLKSSDVIMYTDKYLLVSLNEELDYKARYNTFFNLDTKSACEGYLEGLNWVMNYYYFHNHDNWSWYYKYHASPFLSDIVRCCKTYEFKEIPKSRCVSFLEQLFLVLPESSLRILTPECYKSRINTLLNHSFVQEYFPKYLILNMIRKDALWKSTLLIPNISDDILLLL